MAQEQLVEEIRKKLLVDKSIKKIAEDFLLKLNKEIKKQKVDANAELGGSVAKGTFLPDDFDADIFIRFNPDLKFDISNETEKLLGFLKDVKRVHGSRDYFQLVYNNVLFEIVPVIDVDTWSKAKNVSDMSPLHVKYFNKKADDKTREEVKITKLFMKAQRVYGAESYIKGFSGHVVDLLIIKYGSFLELVKMASKWKDKTVIDVEKHHADPLFSLNESKTSSPLVIVDPIQKDRNASAALSTENYESFKKACKEFIKKGGVGFFEKKDFEKLVLERKNFMSIQNCIFDIDVVPLEEKDDVAGSKVLKIKEHLLRRLTDEGFSVVWSDWDFEEEKSIIALEIPKENIKKVFIRDGPQLDMKGHSEEFKKKHKDVFEEEDRLKAKVKRNFVDPKSAIISILKDKYVVERCKGIFLK
ncbi:nucleotidyltransferase domain-containing protein [Candidatus Woesearchaeota archaeon]|nr:nucleotidyltransferase domain-containing protein [Candidatus Woesearchaeota archaeon]MCF7901201.1 nucleotidyltransferase domain-containing protein [Candidatus Woesearchaeota archaeon]MCF8013704.1 nucleotidyltransferase domain-containing protein [Candidatus Woesearchaeota archaeon]